MMDRLKTLVVIGLVQGVAIVDKPEYNKIYIELLQFLMLSSSVIDLAWIDKSLHRAD